jgi:O-antigen/teichoic acid export membrane protein
MLKNGIYNVLFSLVRLSLNFLLVPILIRFMGIEDYGVWTFVSTTLAIVMLAEGGLSSSVVFFTSQALAADDNNRLSEVLTVITFAMLMLATLAALSIAGVSPWVVNFIPRLTNSQQLVTMTCVQLGSVVVWSRMIQGLSIVLEMAYDRYGLMNLLTTIQSILTTLGMISISYLGGKLIELMQWQVLVSLGGMIIHSCIAWSLIKHKNVKIKWNRYNSIDVFKYSFSVWLTSLGGAIFQQGDKLIVSSVLGPRDLGVYAAITNIASQINTLSGMVIQPLLPKLSSILGNESIKAVEIKHEIKQATQLNSSVVFGLGGMLLILDFWITSTLFGQELRPQYITDFRIAVVIYTIYSLNAVGYFLLLGSGRANLSLIATLSGGIVSLTMIFIGSSQMGLQGAIIGNSGYILVWMLNFWAMKLFDFSPQDFFKWCSIPVLVTSISLFCNYAFLPETDISAKLMFCITEGLVLLAWLANNR